MVVHGAGLWGAQQRPPGAGLKPAGSSLVVRLEHPQGVQSHCCPV